MFVPLNALPDSSRVWIYPVGRQLTQPEEEQITAALQEFTRNWQAHGHDLKASCSVLLHRFVVLAVDQAHTDPSGCAIDYSVGAVRQILQRLGADIMDRGHVFFIFNNTIQPVPVVELKKTKEEGFWQAHTPVFDTTVTTLCWLRRNPLPASQTWLHRYLRVSV